MEVIAVKWHCTLLLTTYLSIFTLKGYVCSKGLDKETHAAGRGN